jgi:hypothetical protein
MSSDRRDAKKELDAILESLLDAIETAPPEEIAEDLRATGQDISKIADDVKSSLLAGVKHFEQRKLREAREAYKVRTRNPVVKYMLPSTPEARRNQLLGVFTQRPEMRAMLTAQHRDFDSLADKDIASALQQLAELGVFDDTDGNDPQ